MTRLIRLLALTICLFLPFVHLAPAQGTASAYVCPMHPEVKSSNTSTFTHSLNRMVV